MQKNILTLNEFDIISDMLSVLRTIGLLETIDYLITWQKKPSLILNSLGNFEFEDPEEVYGCTITFWDKNGNFIGESRFKIGEDDGQE